MYYAPAFYGWAYNPWAAPVAYAWGWNVAPWYGYYPGYFTPYPVYASPALWLTDYLVAQSLETAYAAHVAAQQEAGAEALAAGGAPPAPLTPEAKQMIADEVQRQIALENAEAKANAGQQVADAGSSSIERAIDDVAAGKPRVFVAGKELDVLDANQQECAVTDGDLLQMSVAPPAAATSATLTVVSSKGGVECKPNVQVSVPLDELQEMQNHMRETVDQGLQELQAKQGKGGLPAAPPSAMIPTATALVAQGAPPPDPAGAQELAAQAQQADAAEKDVAADTSGGAPAGPAAAPAATSAAAPVAAPATVSVSLGQSIADVTAAVGQPSKILNLGPKTVYVYSDMKVTFKAGKVTDVQ